MNTTVSLKMHPIVCCGCGISFQIPDEFDNTLRRTHKTFWCPRGCANHYPGESGEERAERLRKRAEDALARERARHDQTKADRDHKERQRRGEKAAKTRMKNRVKNGVCPCCNRHFTNLQRHMESKHPDWREK